MGIFHPAVEEIAFAARKRLDERSHTLPRALAKPVGFCAADGQENLPRLNVASVFDRILVPLHQIAVFGFPDNGNSAVFHTFYAVAARIAEISSVLAVKFSVRSPSPHFSSISSKESAVLSATGRSA